MPVLFVGHGSPMNAIEENQLTKEWNLLGKTIPKPRAIICISAHWLTNGTQITTMEQPKTIHDFYGFPSDLYQVQYPAPGYPRLFDEIVAQISDFKFQSDLKWGLDHGTWSVLKHIYPEANIPVVQLSIDYLKPAEYHYKLGQALSFLRENDILIVASGNIVHNLGKLSNEIEAYDWAREFDEKMADLIFEENHETILNYMCLGDIARLSVPSPEHFLPLIYALGAAGKTCKISFFTEAIVMGAIGMRGVKFE